MNDKYNTPLKANVIVINDKNREYKPTKMWRVDVRPWWKEQ